MPALRLADYRLEDVLGVGTVGTIYAGQHRASGKRVAVKILHPAISRDRLIRARFKREMTILERLRHPHVIAYDGGGENDGQLFYVMELVEGGTVKDLLESGGPLRWPAVVDVARQVASALQCAHNHGVIHRDLKPGNLFLTRQGQVKLGDFGIARDVTSSDLTAEGLTVGTHAYMAPEQITGDAMISGKADLYALGCCLFEILTGRKVFLGENFAQLFEQHLHADPPRVRSLVPDCPEPLDAIIDQLLAKDPEARPFNARQVQAAMLKLSEQHALSGGDAASVVSGPDVPADRVTETGRRILQQQIERRLRGEVGMEISWSRLATVALVISVVVAFAALLSR